MRIDNATSVVKGGKNILAVFVDPNTGKSGWWYEGGGIYRNVWFTAVESPGPVIAPWGLYVGGSKPTGEISWDSDGNPSADSELMPQIELWNNPDKYENSVYTLPKHLDEKVARLHLAKIGVEIDELSNEQADYIGVPVQGPFKGEAYRY